MKKLFAIILFVIPMLGFCQKQKECSISISQQWEFKNYARDMAELYEKEAESYSKDYLVNKLIEFKKHCRKDSILVLVFDADGRKTTYYKYKKPEPTFEYFIEWIQEHK